MTRRRKYSSYVVTGPKVDRYTSHFLMNYNELTVPMLNTLNVHGHGSGGFRRDTVHFLTEVLGPDGATRFIRAQKGAFNGNSLVFVPNDGSEPLLMSQDDYEEYIHFELPGIVGSVEPAELERVLAEFEEVVQPYPSMYLRSIEDCVRGLARVVWDMGRAGV